MKYILIISLFLLGGIQQLKAQSPELIRDPEFQIAAKSAIDSLYNRNPGAVSELMKPWSNRYPDHPVWLLWEAMDVWWVVLTDLYNESHDERLFDIMDEADRAARNLLDENPNHADGHIIRAVANGYIARQHANRERWVRSVRTARTAHRAHMRLEETAPDLADNLLAEGLKLYYSEYLPEAYTLVRAVSWLLPSGDKKEGLRLLNITSNDAVFARPEATYFLGTILLNYEHDYNGAMARFRTLANEYPNNSFYRRLLVRSLFQQGRFGLAEEEIENALSHWNRHGIDNEDVLKEELLYWRGRIMMRRGNHQQAHEDLTESYRTGMELPNRKKRSFHALSGFYAGITAERNNDLTAARNFYRAVTQLECEPDTRNEAKKRMERL